jgi:hypothetical protein
VLPAVTADIYDTLPGTAGNRLLESPTVGVLTGATREMASIGYGVGVGLACVPDDVTAL